MKNNQAVVAANTVAPAKINAHNLSHHIPYLYSYHEQGYETDHQTESQLLAENDSNEFHEWGALTKEIRM